MSKDTCPYCESGEVVQGIHVGKNAESGHVGLKYQTALVLTGTEPLLADVCSKCGSVVRLWVQNPERKWWTA